MSIIIDDDGVMHKVLTMNEMDKMRAEIRAESKKNYTNSTFNKGLYRAIEIIDKYREVNE